VRVERRPVHRLVAGAAGPGGVPAAPRKESYWLEANRTPPPSLVDVSKGRHRGPGRRRGDCGPACASVSLRHSCCIRRSCAPGPRPWGNPTPPPSAPRCLSTPGCGWVCEKPEKRVAMTVRQPKPPKSLGVEGRSLWRAIVADVAGRGIELDARELSWLRQQGKLADRVAMLEEALDGADLIVPGHAKQPVANPLLGEVGQHQALLAQTLGRLRVDVVEPGAGQPVTGNRFRSAALSRWRGSA
jgi:hypothetical protein